MAGHLGPCRRVQPEHGGGVFITLDQEKCRVAAQVSARRPRTKASKASGLSLLCASMTKSPIMASLTPRCPGSSPWTSATRAVTQQRAAPLKPPQNPQLSAIFASSPRATFVGESGPSIKGPRALIEKVTRLLASERTNDVRESLLADLPTMPAMDPGHPEPS